MEHSSNINSLKNTVEVYFSEAGLLPLSKSILKDNKCYLFKENLAVGDISNVNIDINIDWDSNVRIWTSHNNIQEFLGLLYFCHKFRGKKISVIFTDEYSKSVHSVSTTTGDEIEKMLKYEKKLTMEEIIKYKNAWERLVSQNGEMRIFEHNKVKSIPFNYLKNHLLTYYVKDQKLWIKNLMNNDKDNHFSRDIWELLIEKI